MTNDFLICEGVKKHYKLAKNDSVEVLKGINLRVDRGEWVAILGASGCGKTTLLNLIGTLERFDAGRIVCDGWDYAKMNARETARFRSLNIGFIFQAYHLIADLTVLGNVMIANTISPKPDDSVKKRAIALLEQLGLGHRLKHHPYELSGGEQQRTAIARALINNPRFLLTDEPTGNLDHATGLSILEILKEYHVTHADSALLMITHDVEIASHADRIVCIRDGVIENDNASLSPKTTEVGNE